MRTTRTTAVLEISLRSRTQSSYPRNIRKCNLLGFISSAAFSVRFKISHLLLEEEEAEGAPLMVMYAGDLAQY